MKLHEYQAKEVLARYGVAVPRGRVATTAADAGGAATELGGSVVVKAQAHTGARGKAGGIKLVADPGAAEAAAAEILGSRLVTNQTGPAGLPVDAVLVEERLAIARELYLSVVIDNAAGMADGNRVGGGRHGDRTGRRRAARARFTASTSIRPVACSRFRRARWRSPPASTASCWRRRRG